LAPHIDFVRGGTAYAHAYRALAECPPPDTIVALGVAHVSPPSPWAFSRKTYRTPLGDLALDEPLYEELVSGLDYDPLADEWTHLEEHSLEFQAVWLRHLWGERTPPWVPILCSSFEAYGGGRAPSRVRLLERTLVKTGKILKRLRDSGKKVLVLGGVDFAHVGLCFGDERAPDAATRKKIEQEDRVSITHALGGNADAFYLSTIKGGGWRKVCGLSAVYTAVRLLKDMAPEAKAELLAYGQADDPRGGVVSFAGAIYR